MDIAKLKLLIDSDASNAAKTDGAVLLWCNTPSISAEYTSLSGADLLSNTNGDELSALTDAKAQTWLSLCAIPSVPVGNNDAAAKLAVSLFGNGSTTLNNLASRRSYSQTPMESVELGFARLGYIQEARKQ